MALTVLELTIETRLAWNSQRPSCLRSAKTKGMSHHAQFMFYLFLEAQFFLGVLHPHERDRQSKGFIVKQCDYFSNIYTAWGHIVK